VKRLRLLLDQMLDEGVARALGALGHEVASAATGEQALEELRRVAARGACLVKWLPSAQNIRPDDPRCFPFYEALAALGMPLLSHTGCEHTLAAYPDAFNAPLRLVPALERGVTVIAAHCGTRLFLHERSWFGQWRELALRHPNLYGDLAAFLVSERASYITGSTFWADGGLYRGLF